MTDIPITANERKAQFTGNTGLGPFAFTFNVLVSGDLRVLKNNVALTINTEYTVSLNVDGTGSVTLTGSGNGTALIASDVLTIIGNRQLARTSDYVQGGNLFAGALNEDLDSIVIMMQQIDEKVSRTMRIDAGDVGDNLLLPSQSTRASKYLAFDSSGDPIAVSGTTSTIVVSSYMEDLLLTTDSASAFAYLGVTATASELNTLDGVTASTAEINLLDGVTASTAEINKLDGVAGDVVGTSDTQTLTNKTLTSPVIGSSISGTAIASQVEAEAGTASDKLMTPQRTAQAITALTPPPDMEFIVSRSASNDASVAFTEFDATKYGSYMFVLSNVIPATDGVNLYFRTSSNGGSSYDAGASDYKYTILSNAQTGGGTSTATADYILLVAHAIGSAAGEDGVSGTFTLTGAGTTKRTALVGSFGNWRNDGAYVSTYIAGARDSAAIVDAVQFLFSSGDVESGTIEMYGLRNS